MFKTITLIKKKPGMSRQEFIDYYEKRHAPLIRELLPPIAIYRRNYVVHDDWLYSAGNEPAAEPSFDAMTEGLFNTREEAEAFVIAARNLEIAQRVRADEDNFVLPGFAQTYIVELHQSPIP